MTILYSLYTPGGIVFSADTIITRQPRGQRREFVASRDPKVIRIPRLGEHRQGAVIGYYGLAQVGDRGMPEFLRESVRDWPGSRTLDEFAAYLVERFQREARAIHLRTQIFGFHLGGFERFEGYLCPAFYYIRNGEANEDTGRYELFGRSEIRSEEQLMRRTLADWQPHQARRALQHFQRENGIPMWFRNGDLGTMAGPTQAVELAAKYLADQRDFGWPLNTRRWADFAETMVDTTASLAQAMYRGGAPTIGGRAVSVDLPWPG